MGISDFLLLRQRNRPAETSYLYHRGITPQVPLTTFAVWRIINWLYQRTGGAKPARRITPPECGVPSMMHLIVQILRAKLGGGTPDNTSARRRLEGSSFERYMRIHHGSTTERRKRAQFTSAGNRAPSAQRPTRQCNRCRCRRFRFDPLQSAPISANSRFTVGRGVYHPLRQIIHLGACGINGHTDARACISIRIWRSV